MTKIKHCDCCGYETDQNHIKFHKGSMYEEICDMCFFNTMSLRDPPSQELNWVSFAQAIHWLNDQLKRVRDEHHR